MQCYKILDSCFDDFLKESPQNCSLGENK